ncbi:hypothetical protein ACH42_00185 [Endozoicomonas sp. (ex Bugula neritina AB1)]|nr:hypothetical protein ACH42_00185 [Endozoicomonas sp. (ex Bugula neritina AB1)]
MPHAETTKIIQDKLNLSLKEIYPLAQKADEQLEQLKEEEKGKFSAIFQPDSGFKAQSNRFLPYLIELSEEVRALSDTEADGFSGALQILLGKIKKMHLILNRFHRTK